MPYTKCLYAGYKIAYLLNLNFEHEHVSFYNLALFIPDLRNLFYVKTIKEKEEVKDNKSKGITPHILLHAHCIFIFDLMLEKNMGYQTIFLNCDRYQTKTESRSLLKNYSFLWITVKVNFFISYKIKCTMFLYWKRLAEVVFIYK